jgi:hypothetical protein
MRLKALIVSVFAGLVFSAAPAQAALVTFLDQGTWLAAVSSVTTADFNDAANQTGFTKPGFGASSTTPAGGITVDTILFQVIDNGVAVAGAVRDPGGSPSFEWTYPNPTTNLGDYFKDLTPDSSHPGTSHVHVTLPGSGATAWGSLFGFANTGAAPVIWMNGTQCITCSPTANTITATLNAAFFGVTSDTPITTVDIFFPSSLTTGYLMVDDFAIGTANVQGGGGGGTPEVCTLILTGSALVAFARMLRRLKLGQTSAAA